MCQLERILVEVKVFKLFTFFIATFFLPITIVNNITYGLMLEELFDVILFASVGVFVGGGLRDWLGFMCF